MLRSLLAATLIACLAVTSVLGWGDYAKAVGSSSPQASSPESSCQEMALEATCHCHEESCPEQDCPTCLVHNGHHHQYTRLDERVTPSRALSSSEKKPSDASFTYQQPHLEPGRKPPKSA